MAEEAGFANHRSLSQQKTDRVECGIFFFFFFFYLEKHEALNFCVNIFVVSACCSQLQKIYHLSSSRYQYIPSKSFNTGTVQKLLYFWHPADMGEKSSMTATLLRFTKDVFPVLTPGKSVSFKFYINSIL